MKRGVIFALALAPIEPAFADTKGANDDCRCLRRALRDLKPCRGMTEKQDEVCTIYQLFQFGLCSQICVGLINDAEATSVARKRAEKENPALSPSPSKREN